MSETTNIATFTGNTDRARTHITIAVDRLAEVLANAEDVGYRRALTDARVEGKDRHRLLNNIYVTWKNRCDLYAACWKKIEIVSASTRG